MAKAASDSHAGTPAELLRKIRIPCVQRASLRRGTAREEVFVIDVGWGGIFVERPLPLPLGERVDIEFPLPGNEIPIRGECSVAWWHPPGAPLRSKVLPAGLGLTITGMTPNDRKRLEEHIRVYCSKGVRERRFLPDWPSGEGRSQT